MKGMRIDVGGAVDQIAEDIFALKVKRCKIRRLRRLFDEIPETARELLRCAALPTKGNPIPNAQAKYNELCNTFSDLIDLSVMLGVVDPRSRDHPESAEFTLEGRDGLTSEDIQRNDTGTCGTGS